MNERSVLRKLKRLPYGKAEAGRKRDKIIKFLIIKVARFWGIPEMSEKYAQHDGQNHNNMTIVKDTDDVLMAGFTQSTKNFMNVLGKRFC